MQYLWYVGVGQLCGDCLWIVYFQVWYDLVCVFIRCMWQWVCMQLQVFVELYWFVCGVVDLLVGCWYVQLWGQCGGGGKYVYVQCYIGCEGVGEYDDGEILYWLILYERC